MISLISFSCRHTGRAESTVISDIIKTNGFVTWLEQNPEETFSTPSLNKFLCSTPRTAMAHNRMGTEIKRFAKYNLLQGHTVDFTKKLEPPRNPVQMEVKDQELIEREIRKLLQKTAQAAESNNSNSMEPLSKILTC